MKFSVLLTSLLFITQMVFAQEKPSEQLYQEAYENFVKRDYPAASAALDKINPVDQKKADVLNLRGAIYKRMGELDNAANAYTDALKINPKDWVPKYNLAEVNFLRQQYKSSRAFLEQALASMPESDRLQKQDLILYKVYLTYLLQGDEEKAKLLLDSFDVNSANPVYYFAQAAWSYKKKDEAKAKTWVNSTDGLYSQDLRNSYGQALVDVGWLDPSAGIGAAALTANAAPAETPAPVAVAASPTPAVDNPSEVVPLASNNATPIAVTEPSATPVASVVAESPTPATTLPEVAAVENAQAAGKRAPLGLWLAILTILAIAGIILINLAKRSRIVPAPEDNTGYAAIAASASPETSAAISHSSEGTGAVLEQDADGEVAPAPIRISPIHRDYANAAPADVAFAESKSLQSSGPAKSTSRSRSKGKSTPAAKPATRKAPVPKTIPAAVSTAATARTPAKKSTKLAVKANAVDETPIPAAEGKTSSRKTVAKPAAKRTRLVPIPTTDVPPPDVAPPKLMVSNIETLSVDPTREAAAPARNPASKAKANARTKAPGKAPSKAPASRSTAPLITIPEFEDSSIDTTSNPTIRLVPENNDSGNQPEKV